MGIEVSYHVLLAILLKKNIIISASSEDEAIVAFKRLHQRVLHLLWLLTN